MSSSRRVQVDDDDETNKMTNIDISIIIKKIFSEAGWS